MKVATLHITVIYSVKPVLNKQCSSVSSQRASMKAVNVIHALHGRELAQQWKGGYQVAAIFCSW